MQTIREIGDFAALDKAVDHDLHEGEGYDWGAFWGPLTIPEVLIGDTPQRAIEAGIADLLQTD